MKSFSWLIAVFVAFGFKAKAVQVVSDYEHASCQEFRLVKELRVYKDPSIFVGNLGQMYNDPHQGWASLMNENPVLTTLEGTIHLMKLGSPMEFKNYGVISRLYELADPRFKAKAKKRSLLNKLRLQRLWWFLLKFAGAVIPTL